MSSICPEMNFSPDERALLTVRDGEIKRWLKAAQAGDEEAREDLLCWAHATARNYYGWKARSERWFSVDDAEDLATDFLLEFEQALPRVLSVTHFTRHVMKRMLKRYIRNKKERLGREAPRDLGASPGRWLADETPRPWEAWNDETWRRYQITLHTLAAADETTRTIITRRFGEPAHNSTQIADELLISPGAVRMRIARFYGRVRRRCGRGA